MTWSYLPHTELDRRSMLDAIGVSSIDKLFEDVPTELRMTSSLQLPLALSEPELVKHLTQLAALNNNMGDLVCFLGAGAYDHYIPSVVDHVLRRSEFSTAYTQYQPEISQGYLQALWEYQSMIAEITGMEVANASMYDGATAVAEAAMMACSASGRKTIVMSLAVHPSYQKVCVTYTKDRAIDYTLASVQDGITDLTELSEQITDSTAAVILQFPNFFGCLEDLKQVADIAHAKGAYLIAVVDPIALGILESPGTLGADIVVGEGQSLGISLNFGGPYLGFFATTEKLMRKMPGRIVGQTVDTKGNRGFVLTLQAREQHIRRDKATSNICSNEALCALAAAVYMSTVGKEGYREIAMQCLQKAHYAYRCLINLPGCDPVYKKPFFKEFAVRFNQPIAQINEKLLSKGFLGGLDLGKYDKELDQCMLLCITEKRTKEEIDSLVRELEALL